MVTDEVDQLVVDRHAFLTSTWVAAASRLRRLHQPAIPQVRPIVRVNLTITPSPDDGLMRDLHVDTVEGEPRVLGSHVRDRDVLDAEVWLDLEAARLFLVERDATQLSEALRDGRVDVRGDAFGFLSIAGDDSTEARAYYEALRRMTY